MMDDDPVILLSPLHDGDPRLLDTVFNMSSLTSGIFNNSLFQYAGLVIVGIILFGEIQSFKRRFTEILQFRRMPLPRQAFSWLKVPTCYWRFYI